MVYPVIENRQFFMIASIEEIPDIPTNPETIIRTYGVPSNFDPLENTVLIKSPSKIQFSEGKNAAVKVDLSFIENTSFHGVQLVQVVGVISDSGVIKARSIKDVSGMDMNIFERTLNLLKSRFHGINI